MSGKKYITYLQQINQNIASGVTLQEKLTTLVDYLLQTLEPEKLYITKLNTESLGSLLVKRIVFSNIETIPAQLEQELIHTIKNPEWLHIENISESKVCIIPIYYSANQHIANLLVYNPNKTYTEEQLHQIISPIIPLFNTILQLEYFKSEEADLDRISNMIWNSMSEAVFISTFDGKIIEVNQQACKLTEYSRSELLKMNISELEENTLEDDVEKQLNLLQQSEQLIFGAAIRTKTEKIIPLSARSYITEFRDQEVFLSFIKTSDLHQSKDSKILATIIETEKKERNRFAKDLHDGIGPLLSCIKMYVEDLLDPNTEAAEKNEIATHTLDMIDDAILNIRRVADNLMPTILKEYGLEKALAAFCKKVNLPGKTKFIFHSNLSINRLPSNIEFELYQIVHELINNTLKHAEATQAEIEMLQNNDSLSLSYRDNGIGFDVSSTFNKTIGAGLSNIKQRVELLNGTFLISSKLNQGIHIDIHLSKLNTV